MKRAFTEGTQKDNQQALDATAQNAPPKRRRWDDAGTGVPVPNGHQASATELEQGCDSESDSAEQPAIMQRLVEVPEHADLAFVQRLFEPTSHFPARVFEETSCQIALGFGEGSTVDRQRPVVSICCGSMAGVGMDVAVSRVKSLFRLGPSSRDNVLDQFAKPPLILQPPPSVQEESSGEVRTASIDFSRIGLDGRNARVVPMPKHVLKHLMTSRHARLLAQVTGAEIQWDPPNVVLGGGPEQIAKAEKLLSRVRTHCNWGASNAKVMQLISPAEHLGKSIRCRLSPMGHLKAFERSLTASQKRIFIGKDPGSDVALNDEKISKQHCVIELDVNRGGVYIIDTSSHGTFLNGRRLPSKATGLKVGKVMVSHGDELLLKDPKKGDNEFGYVVNLQTLS